MRRSFGALIAVVALSSPAVQAAEDEWIRVDRTLPFLAATNQAIVTITNAAKGGCWTNADATKDAVELTLHTYGIKTFDKIFDADQTNGLAPEIDIVSSGPEISKDYCSATLEVTATYFVHYNLPWNSQKRAGSYMEIWRRNVSGTGPKSTYSERSKGMFLELIEEFVLDVQKAKEEAAKYPQLFIAK